MRAEDRHAIASIPPIALFCLVTSSMACGVDDQVHQAALRDLQQQKQLVIARNADLDAKEAENEALKKRLAALESEKTGVSSALADAKKTMEDLLRAQAQAEARAAQFRTLVERFRKMTESGKLKVEIRDNRMIVSLGDRILFDPGKTQVKKEGAETLKQVTAILKEVQGRDFQVAGHTDNAPIKSARYRSNWDLSTARAVEVVNFMIASGMESGRLSAAGYSDQAPVASNDSPDGRSSNRRIEITLMPNLDDLPPILAESGKGGGAATSSGSAGATETAKAGGAPGGASAPPAASAPGGIQPAAASQSKPH
jgi:chemotaxis protein MotB